MTRAGTFARLVVAACLALGACSTATPYQPVEAGADKGGYSSQRIEPDRYRVAFAGNSLTSRETVETYLLYRAAELTREQGYDWFEMAARTTERDVRTVVDRPFGPGPWGWWGPSWRYYGPAGGRAWDPYWRTPFWAEQVDVRTIDRYEASAEIVMHRGANPAGNPRAFAARAVMESLRPQIRWPDGPHDRQATR